MRLVKFMKKSINYSKNKFLFLWTRKIDKILEKIKTDTF